MTIAFIELLPEAVAARLRPGSLAASLTPKRRGVTPAADRFCVDRALGAAAVAPRRLRGRGDRPRSLGDKRWAHEMMLLPEAPVLAEAIFRQSM